MPRKITRNSQHSIEVSADAAVRLNSARVWIESFPTDAELLLIANSPEAGNDLHLKTVASRGASFGVKRFSLNFLASRMAQRAFAESGSVPATNLSFTAVVAR